MARGLLSRGFALAFVLAAGCTEKPRVLRLYNWVSNIAPETVAAFERKYGCKVEISTFDTNEEMLERVGGRADFDLIAPSSYVIGQMRKERLIVRIDHSRCPNVKRNFDPKFVTMLQEDPELLYAVPYGLSHAGLLYTSNAVPAGVDVGTWAVLGDPALRSHAFLLDDMREALGVGLLYLGHSANSTDEREVAAAADQLIKWSANGCRWDSDDAMFEENDSYQTWVWHAYGDTANHLLLGNGEPVAHPDLAFASPREGCVFSCEELVVSAHASNPDLAHAFIDFLYSDPAVGKAQMEYLGSLLPCVPALGALSPEQRRLIEPSQEELARGQLLEGFEDRPDVQAFYEREWSRVVRSRVVKGR